MAIWLKLVGVAPANWKVELSVLLVRPIRPIVPPLGGAKVIMPRCC